MKLTHVFGLVVAVHAAVFTVIFATPGCRSTGKQKPRPEDTSPASAGVTNAPVDTLAATPVAPMSNDAINAGAPASPTPVAVAPAVTTPVSTSTDGLIHFAPTRPAALAPAVEVPAPSTASHTVAKGDSLWTIAKKYGITTAELSAANKLAPSATLRIGQQLSVPSRVAATPSTAAAEAANTYAVKAGDTLGGIARKHGTTAAALRTANNLSGDNLRVGQKLVIPGNAAPLSASAPSVSGPAIAPAAPSASAPRAGGVTHTIAPGDTLGSIARKYGVKVGEIGTLNNITDPAKLRVGQVIKLPATAVRPAASAPAPAPAPSASSGPVIRDEPALPVAPVSPVEAATPVTPVNPIEPGVVPLIRIE
ncbi:MAG: hypothetical protein RL376_1340 [Verrucomicrobiota bacterium]|jgi:LysM repeat protein